MRVTGVLSRGAGDMSLTSTALAQACNAIAGDIDSRRWQLARLAQQARNEHLPAWAEIMAHTANVRRKPRTIREWAQTADFADACPKQYALTFSHYSRASRYMEVLPMDTIFEVLDEAEAECVDVDSMAAHLSSLAKKDPDPFHLGDWLSGELERARAALAEAVTDAEIEAVQRAVAFFDAELARVMGTEGKTK